MRIFVRNLFTKLVLLALCCTPLALYALHQFKQLAVTSSANAKDLPPVDGTIQDLKRDIDQSGRYTAMPADVRNELLCPTGASVKDTSDALYRPLTDAVKTRASILSGQRHFLLQCAAIRSSGDKMPAFQGDLQAEYEKLWEKHHVLIAADAGIARLRAEISSADSKRLEELQKQLKLDLETYADSKGQPHPHAQAVLDELARRQAIIRQDTVKSDSDELNDRYLACVRQAPDPKALGVVKDDLKKIVAEFRRLESALATRSDSTKLTWVKDQLKLWEGRQLLLTKAIELIGGLDKFLADSKGPEFIAECNELARNRSPEERKLLLSLADELCAHFIRRLPRESLKYDPYVEIADTNGKLVNVPQALITIQFENGTSKNLEENGEPLSQDQNRYSEFEVRKEKGKVKYVIVYKEGRKDEREDIRDRKLADIKSTKRNQAVQFFCEQFRAVATWNSSAIRSFHKKLTSPELQSALGEGWQQKYLGEIWIRLNALKEAMDRSESLFSSVNAN